MRTSYPAPPAATATLLSRATDAARASFGFAELRPYQDEVLRHILSGRDCLAVLPTGSGKSLCYALPALVRPGLVLVISPLIALIRDQVRKFTEHGIASAALDSLQSPEEKNLVWDRVGRGDLRLLFVSPERLARPDFRARLKAQELQLVAIDEAHCISHWGSHFRPDYRYIGDYLRELGPVQKLAVTATATAKVREDIASALRLTAPGAVWADFARSNLDLKVIKTARVAAQFSAVLEAVLNTAGSGIVYAPTRKNAREVHLMLSDAGVKAVLYHGGLPAEARQASQRAFMTAAARVVVATHAFGLGIDKADIRFVHHFGLPGSLEQYVQEIGRAGRDGLPAKCWLVYGPRDYYIQKFMLDKSFPDVSSLKEVFEAALAFVDGAVGQSPHAVLGHLQRTIGASRAADLSEALGVLCREGLLTKLKAGGWAEELIGAGRTGEAAAVFRDYPLRKIDNMAKLEAVRTFAGLGADARLAYLDEYFHKG